jgi:hypothetical protein
MSMSVMGIRQVRMIMHQGRVPVRMAVGLAERIVGTVTVLVMIVVYMGVFVLHRRVFVSMGVALEEQRRDSRRHADHRGHID